MAGADLDAAEAERLRDLLAMDSDSDESEEDEVPSAALRPDAALVGSALVGSDSESEGEACATPRASTPPPPPENDASAATQRPESPVDGEDAEPPPYAAELNWCS